MQRTCILEWKQYDMECRGPACWNGSNMKWNAEDLHLERRGRGERKKGGTIGNSY
jgi:hypothetical protein